MLQHLSVKNFAIIDHIDLDFGPGMTVLTGETGAGKSLLIDAVSLVAGDRASQDMVRGGCDKAEIEAVFTIDGDRLTGILDGLGIEHGDGRVRIRREIAAKGASVIRVNERVVTLAQLRDIASRTVDVHTQFDSQRLFDPANYVELLDGFRPDRTRVAREAYAERLRAYAAADAAWRTLTREREELERGRDLYRHQLEELERFELDPDEESRLREERLVLLNFDRIDSALRAAKHGFDDSGLLDGLYAASNEIERIASFGQDFAKLRDRIRDAYYELDDVRDELEKRLRELDFDADRNAEVERRLAALEDLVRKYRKPVVELVALRNELRRLLDRGDNYEDYLRQADAARREAYRALLGAATDLTALRREIATRIERELAAAFADLCLQGTRFQIVFASGLPDEPLIPSELLANGADHLDFLISTNVGEPLRPLAKTASGGETSRIMLAFKTIFVKTQELSAIVFDEIDTGISGVVARQVARKIRAVAAACQVVAISHVPQVVAAADRQIHVVKHERDGRTVAGARELGFDERVGQLAEMLSGVHDSAAGTAQAKELLLNP